jgi:hypothetical protein
MSNEERAAPCWALFLVGHVGIMWVCHERPPSLPHLRGKSEVGINVSQTTDQWLSVSQLSLVCLFDCQSMLSTAGGPHS